MATFRNKEMTTSLTMLATCGLSLALIGCNSVPTSSVGTAGGSFAGNDAVGNTTPTSDNGNSRENEVSSQPNADSGTSGATDSRNSGNGNAESEEVGGGNGGSNDGSEAEGDSATSDDLPLLGEGSFSLTTKYDQFFMIRAEHSGALIVEMTGNQGDLDLLLYDMETPDPLAASLGEATSNERIEIDVTEGDYILVIAPWEGQGGSHTLRIDLPDRNDTSGGNSGEANDDSFEPDDTPGEAKVIQVGEYDLIGDDLDWFIFDVSTSSDVGIAITAGQGDLDLYLFEADDLTNPVDGSFGENTSNEQIRRQLGAGRYLILIEPWEGQGAPYRLTLNMTGANGGSEGGNGTQGADTESRLAGNMYSYRDSESSGSDPNFPLVFILETYIDLYLCSDGTYQEDKVTQSSFSGREQFFYRGEWEVIANGEVQVLKRTILESDDPSIVPGSSGYEQQIEFNQNGTLFLHGGRYDIRESNPYCN